jgi:hypothetical protein
MGNSSKVRIFVRTELFPRALGANTYRINALFIWSFLVVGGTGIEPVAPAV